MRPVTPSLRLGVSDTILGVILHSSAQHEPMFYDDRIRRRGRVARRPGYWLQVLIPLPIADAIR